MQIPDTLRLLVLLNVSLLSGCAASKPEPVYTNVQPRAEKLSESVLQAMQPNSTDLLKKAETWYDNSGKLLDSVTSKFAP